VSRRLRTRARVRRPAPAGLERFRIGAAVVEHPENARQVHALPAALVEEPIHLPHVVVRNDLRQEVFPEELTPGHVPDLRSGVGVRIRPSTQREISDVFPDEFAQLPCMTHTPRRPDTAIAPEHHERTEPLGPGAFGIGQAEVERVFGREKWHDTIPRHVGSEIDDQVAEIVFFARANGAVREEDERAVTDESPHGMMRVDPRVASRCGVQLRPGRTEFDGENRFFAQCVSQAPGHHRSIRDGQPAMTPPRISRNMDHSWRQLLPR
jgi:hypothetical protein